MKMAIDQLLFTPVATAMFYSIIKTMEGEAEHALRPCLALLLHCCQIGVILSVLATQAVAEQRFVTSQDSDERCMSAMKPSACLWQVKDAADGHLVDRCLYSVPLPGLPLCRGA